MRASGQEREKASRESADGRPRRARARAWSLPRAVVHRRPRRWRFSNRTSRPSSAAVTSRAVYAAHFTHRARSSPTFSLVYRERRGRGGTWCVFTPRGRDPPTTSPCLAGRESGDDGAVRACRDFIPLRRRRRRRRRPEL